MIKRLYSLRTTLTAALALMLTISIAITVLLVINAARDAYLARSITDIEFMTDQLVAMLDPIAAKSTSETEFANQSGALMRTVGEQYFASQGMTGYAGGLTKAGSVLWHPKLAPGSSLNGSDQGKALVDLLKAQNFKGTVFYNWLNAGEKSPRAKFAVVRPLPSKPEWNVMITAYTDDDLLLPFKALQVRSIWIGIVAVAVGIIVSVLLAASLTRFIFRLSGVLDRITAGDLRTDHADLLGLMKRKDELGDMARNLSAMVTSLRSIVQEVASGTVALMRASAELTSASEAVSSGAGNAAQGAGQVARGTSEQAQHADEVSRTMLQFHDTIGQIATGAADSAAEVQRASQLLTEVVHDMEAMADKAEALSNAASESARAAQRGAGVVGGTTEGMNRIRQSVGEAAQELAGLSALSSQITDITESISGIADQTSLLALNAAIEAARAGEHGRGFAVVAEEVRKLADRSAVSARSISDLITRVQQQTAKAVGTMQTGTAEVDQGSKLVSDAGVALAEIITLAQNSAQEMAGITTLTERVMERSRSVVEAFNSVAAVTEENTAATEEMSAGTEQVASAVERIAGLVQQSAAATQEVSSSVDAVTASASNVARSARALEAIARGLERQVAQFRL
ncbi:MAG TPA: methyl-accepting chemotaxis protein [Symbiobacteriaceae bacterium]|nr:methyl-accepting chemotaxis protein [Symbiobacteriaceae bacterium]